MGRIATLALLHPGERPPTFFVAGDLGGSVQTQSQQAVRPFTSGRAAELLPG